MTKAKLETSGLRIRPVEPPPPKERINFKLPVPTIENFQLYLAAYSEMYGTKADPDFVADQIFTAFFESDKGFLAYLKQQAPPAPAGAGVSKAAD